MQDDERDAQLTSGKWQRVSWEEMKALLEEERKQKAKALSLKLQIQQDRGVPKEDLLAALDDA